MAASFIMDEVRTRVGVLLSASDAKDQPRSADGQPARGRESNAASGASTTRAVSPPISLPLAGVPSSCRRHDRLKPPVPVRAWLGGVVAWRLPQRSAGEGGPATTGRDTPNDRREGGHHTTIRWMAGASHSSAADGPLAGEQRMNASTRAGRMDGQQLRRACSQVRRKDRTRVQVHLNVLYLHCKSSDRSLVLASLPVRPIQRR
jgi:hypothetical protein